MKTLSLLAIVFICGCGSEPVGPTTQLETIPNGPNSPCGRIVDIEPPPYGYACCENEPNSKGQDMIYYHYFDGTSTTNLCLGTCVSGACYSN